MPSVSEFQFPNGVNQHSLDQVSRRCLPGGLASL